MAGKHQYEPTLSTLIQILGKIQQDEKKTPEEIQKARPQICIWATIIKK